MISYLTPILVALMGGLTAFATARLGRKGDRENALIDQYQEDRRADRERIDVLALRVDTLERQLLRMLTRDAQWDIHATRVEAQVIALGEIPHERPEALREGVADG